MALSIFFPVLIRGGYTPLSRGVFAALAGTALFVAVARDARGAAAAARCPAVVTLAALALISAASAAWTVAGPQLAIRWALVDGGYAALVIAGAVMARHRRGAVTIATAVAAIAALEAIAGLVWGARLEEPYALRIGGSWRPAGTFEYPPALALLQVSALPVLLVAMVRDRTRLAVPAAGAAGAAGAVLALSSSRAQVALAVLVLAAAIVWPTRTTQSARGLVAAAAGLILAAGAAAYAVAGGYVPPHASGGDEGRLLGLGATIFLASALWWLVRRLAARPTASPLRRLLRPSRLAVRPPKAVVWAVGVVLVMGTIAAFALIASSAPGGARGVEPAGGIGHGRMHIWSAAAETALERPVAGAGAEAFLAASAEHQGRSRTRYAHNLPLDLAVELGLVGLLLCLALYAAAAAALWRARLSPAAWLLGPAVIAFLLTNLIDWPWHLAGAGAIWAASLGGVIGASATDPPEGARSATEPEPHALRD